MSTLAVPCNIKSHTAALAEGLSYRDRIHVRVRGNYCFGEDTIFIRLMRNKKGAVLSVGGRRVELLWGDIIELWSLEEKPDIYCSYVPEVAGILEKLKISVQKCVKANNSADVLYFLDQVAEVKKAEGLLKEARKILAGIRP
jgi:hypothetical protein